MVQYDPRVIHSFADSLYSRANMIIVVDLLGGLLIGGAVGYFASQPLPSDRALIIGLGVTVLGAAVGLGIGMSKAFVLKLQAQTALCQVAIEDNTRALRAQAGAQQAFASAPPSMPAYPSAPPYGPPQSPSSGVPGQSPR